VGEGILRMFHTARRDAANARIASWHAASHQQSLPSGMQHGAPPVSIGSKRWRKTSVSLNTCTTFNANFDAHAQCENRSIGMLRTAHQAKISLRENDGTRTPAHAWRRDMAPVL